MAITVPIKHTQSGIMKTGFYGFNWTYLFFGWFVPLFRGELFIGALHLLFTIVTLGFWQIDCLLSLQPAIHDTHVNDGLGVERN